MRRRLDAACGILDSLCWLLLGVATLAVAVNALFLLAAVCLLLPIWDAMGRVGWVNRSNQDILRQVELTEAYLAEIASRHAGRDVTALLTYRPGDAVHIVFPGVVYETPTEGIRWGALVGPPDVPNGAGR